MGAMNKIKEKKEQKKSMSDWHSTMWLESRSVWAWVHVRVKEKDGMYSNRQYIFPDRWNEIGQTHAVRLLCNGYKRIPRKALLNFVHSMTPNSSVFLHLSSNHFYFQFSTNWTRMELSFKNVCCPFATYLVNQYECWLIGPQGIESSVEHCTFEGENLETFPMCGFINQSPSQTKSHQLIGHSRTKCVCFNDGSNELNWNDLLNIMVCK